MDVAAGGGVGSRVLVVVFRNEWQHCLKHQQQQQQLLCCVIVFVDK